MKRFFLFLIVSAFLTPVFCQDETQAEKSSSPVTSTFTTANLIDNQTIEQPYKGGIELQVQHRFSLIENIDNLFGIYGSANTRLGLNFGITERIMIGAGTTKDYKLQDLQWKVAILRQTEDNSMPISLSYYGNAVLDLRSKDAYGEGEYRDIHRLSYFSQIILARKFSEKISAQVAPSIIYFNAVPEGNMNFNYAIHAGARANLFGNHSLLLEYDQLLTKQENEELQPKPNLSLGWEIGTATHAFQIFVANYTSINNQYNLLYNMNDFTAGDYLFGFNITVRF